MSSIFSDPVPPADLVTHFAARLAHETDPGDVAAARAAGEQFALVDVRSQEAWDQGHIPGAIHIPRKEIAERAAAEIPTGTPVVVYCWGVACNASTRAAVEFATLGYQVKEMLGGYEYWVREGFRFQGADGSGRQAPDPLTAPVTPPVTA